MTALAAADAGGDGRRVPSAGADTPGLPQHTPRRRPIQQHQRTVLGEGDVVAECVGILHSPWPMGCYEGAIFTSVLLQCEQPHCQGQRYRQSKSSRCASSHTLPSLSSHPFSFPRPAGVLAAWGLCVGLHRLHRHKLCHPRPCPRLLRLVPQSHGHGGWVIVPSWDSRMEHKAAV